MWLDYLREVVRQNDRALSEGRIDEKDLPRMLAAEARKTPQPELHIRGDKDVRYERVAQAMATAQQVGLRKIGFITEPKN